MQEIIQNIAIIIKTILHPLETSATKIKVYKANILSSKQIIVVITFIFVRLSIIKHLNKLSFIYLRHTAIPTNKPIKRVDYPDIIYPTEQAKFRNIVEEIKAVHAEGRPILIGTITIEKSEHLSKLLKQEKIRHNVLNAKNHQQESEIIAQANAKVARISTTLS